MKRVVVALVLAGLVVVFLSGCSVLLPDPEIRFENATADIVFTYGVRVGTATHVGTLSPGQTTSYYVGTAGAYNVESMNGSGIWSSLTGTPESFENGHGYTVTFTGTFGVSLYIFLTEDY